MRDPFQRPEPVRPSCEIGGVPVELRDFSVAVAALPEGAPPPFPLSLAEARQRRQWLQEQYRADQLDRSTEST
jgi:hypothetical protein